MPPATAALAGAANAERVLNALARAIDSATATRSTHLDLSNIPVAELDGMRPELRKRFLDAVRTQCTHLSLPSGVARVLEVLPSINQERLEDAASKRELLTVRIGAAAFIPLPECVAFARTHGKDETRDSSGLTIARRLQALSLTGRAEPAKEQPPMGLRELQPDLQRHVVALGLSRGRLTHRQRSQAVEQFRIALPTATHDVVSHAHAQSAPTLGFDALRHRVFAFDRVLRQDLSDKALRRALERRIKECGGRVHLTANTFHRLPDGRIDVLVDTLASCKDLKALHFDVPQLSNASMGIVGNVLQRFALVGAELRSPEFSMTVRSDWVINDLQPLMPILQELPLTKLDIAELSASNEHYPLAYLVYCNGPIKHTLRELKARCIGVQDIATASLRTFTALESLELSIHDMSEQNSAQAFNTFRGLTRLRRLTLPDTLVHDPAASILASLPALESLALESKLTDAGLSQLATLPKLQHLKLSNQSFDDISENALAGFTHLESFGIGGQLTEQQQIRVVQRLTQLKKLEAAICATESDIYALRSLSELTELRLTDVLALEDESFSELAHLKNLITLQFGYDDFDDDVNEETEETRNLANPIKPENLARLTSLTQLECLGLESVSLGNAGLAAVAKSMRGLHTLKIDNDRHVNHEGVAALALCAELRELALTSCRHLDDACVSEIAKCERIETLDLSGCSDVSDASIPALASMLRLSTLIVDGTSITVQGRAKLARSFALQRDS